MDWHVHYQLHLVSSYLLSVSLACFIDKINKKNRDNFLAAATKFDSNFPVLPGEQRGKLFAPEEFSADG